MKITMCLAALPLGELIVSTAVGGRNLSRNSSKSKKFEKSKKISCFNHNRQIYIQHSSFYTSSFLDLWARTTVLTGHARRARRMTNEHAVCCGLINVFKLTFASAHSSSCHNPSCSRQIPRIIFSTDWQCTEARFRIFYL